MLEFHDISISYGRQAVVERISFSLRINCLTVLLGRNGSGKSTLLAALNQQIPYAGKILLDSADLASLPSKERARQIAILPQTIPAPHITVEELVAFGRTPYLDLTGRLSFYDREIIQLAMEKAEVTELCGRYVDTLSGGERQRAHLAMILAQNTPIVVMDEPTAHMDQVHEASFMKCVEKLKMEKTFLVILHDLTLAAEFADELVVLDQKRIAYTGGKSACMEEGILEQTFSVRRYEIEENGERRVFYRA